VSGAAFRHLRGVGKTRPCRVSRPTQRGVYDPAAHATLYGVKRLGSAVVLPLWRKFCSHAPLPLPGTPPPTTDVVMLPSSARAEMTTLPKLDTKCTTPSLIPNSQW
jgi:hypothetical protein